MFPESEDYSKEDEEETYKMVPADRLAFENSGDNDSEDNQRDGFLNDFQLHQREWTAVDLRANAVSGNHESVFKECHSPRREDDENQRPVDVDFQLRKLKVSIPCKSHEDVADNEQQYSC